MNHGTRVMYNNARCRCDPCRQAAAVYRRQRSGKPEPPPIGGPCAWCGTVSDAYMNKPRRGPRPKQLACSERCVSLLRRERVGQVRRWDRSPRTCPWCETSFVPRTERQRVCTPRCGWLDRAKRNSTGNPSGTHQIKPRKCRDCGTPAGESRSPCVYCSSCSAERRRTTNRRKNVKRRGVATLKTYSLAEIGARDKWRCHLCRRRVNPELSGRHDRGPTIDHLVPVSAGGEDIPENVALAHRECNVLRSTGGEVQLRLVG